MNDAPIITQNSLTLSEGQTVVLGAGDLAATDVETADAALQFTVSGVTGGQFELVSNAGVAITTFTQAQLTAGDVQFVHDGNEAAPTYSVSVFDGALTTGPQAAAITFTNVNDAPTAVGDLDTAGEGATITIDLAANDLDPDDGLDLTSIAILGGPTNGSIAINGDGTVDYTHDGSETLSDSFTYTIRDAAGQVSNTATVNLTITPVDDAPVVTNNALVITEGGAVVLTATDLAATDAETAAPALQFTVSGVTGGQFELVSNAGIAITTFTQAQLTAGDVQFVHDGNEAAPTYSVSVFDGALTTGPLAATISFTNVDDAPIITQNSLTLSEGQTVVLGPGDLAATDVETANAALQFTVSGVTGGQFELVSNAGAAITTFTQAQLTAGDVQFVHDGNEAAPTYSVSVFDGALTTGPLAATISFTNVDDAPIITQNTLTLNEGQTVVLGAGDLAATDVETANATLQFTVSGVTGGQFELVANAGVAITTFTQAQLTAGDVQFVHDGNEPAPTYSVSVFDGALTTGPQAAAITFTNVDDAPIITQNSLTISEGQTVVLGAGDLAATDVETAAAALQFTVSGVTGGQFELVSNAGVAITTFTQAQLTAGDVQFVHDGNEAAPTYSVSVFDGALTTGPQAAAITFTNVNDAPTAADDSDTAAEGATITIDLAANDLDPDDGLDLTSIAIVGGPTNGSIAINGDGTVDYTHNGSETISDSFTYTIRDAAGQISNTATVNLTITPVDDAPVVTNNALVITEGGTAVLTATDLAATDAETANSALQFTVSGVTGGQFELVSNAGVAITTFTQAQLTAGDVQFVHDGNEAAPTYSVSVFDGALTTGPLAATISFTNVDDAPIITQNTLTLNEGQTVVLGAGDLAATDAETADAALQFTVSGVTGGQFELVSNTGVAITTFTQAQLTTGDVQFVHDGNEAAPTYSVSVFDGALTTGPLAATITFTNVDDAPIITQNSLTLSEGQTVVLGAGDLAATDVETASPALQFTVSSVTGGQFELVSNAGVAITTFTQAQLTAGDVQFVHDGNEAAPTYSVSVFDGALTTGPLAATITFTNVNDGPGIDLDADDSTAAGTSYTAIWTEGSGPVAVVDSDAVVSDVDSALLTSMTVTIVNLLDGSSESLTADTTGTSIAASYDAATGVLTLTGSDTAANYQTVLRTIVYDNSQVFPSSTARELTVVASDGTTTGNVATSTVVMNLVANDLPTAVDDLVSTPEDTAVVIDATGNDTDPDGDVLTIVDFTQPANGSVSDNGDGTFTYTPDPDFSGTDTFDYVIVDSASGISHYWALDGDATDLVGGSHGVVTGASTVAGEFGSALAFDEVDDQVRVPDIGYANDFTIALTFRADDLSGSSFQYLYSHGELDQPNSVNIYLSEGTTNNLWVEIRDGDDAFSSNLNFDVTSFVGDGQWHDIAVTVGSDGTRLYVDGVLRRFEADTGAGSINPAGDLYFGRREDGEATRFYGGALDSVQIYDRQMSASEVTSLAANVNRGTVTVTVTPQNDPPVAAADAATLAEGATTTIDLAANDSDVDDALDLTSIQIVSGPSYGSVLLNGDGTVDYTHDGSETTADTFTYTIRDATGAVSNTATVNLTVTPVDDAPVLTANALVIAEGSTVVLSATELAATDSETANSALQFTVSGVTGGQFELVSNAGVAITTFTQAQLTAGDVQFVHDGNEAAPTYSVSVFDGALTTGPQAAAITFTNVNDAPTAAGDSDTAAEGATITIDLAANDLDPDDGLDLTSIAIVGGPTNGSIAINGDGTVDYTHDGSETISDSFTYTIRDAAGQISNTATVSLTITPVDDAPIVTNNALVISEGGTVVLSGGELSATDAETADAALQFTVSGVSGGQFELVSNAGVAITTFTQAQLTAGDVQFVHDGNEAAPSYSVSVFDGALTTGPVAATITFTNVDDAPVLTQNSLTLSEGQTVVLGAGDLAATDVETANATLQFTVSGVTGGQFELVSNAGVAITTFTQAQLTAGDVQFVHDGNEAAPTYSVSVFDGALTTGPQAATITFTNVDDAPILTQNALTISEGQTVVLGASDLTATDVETANPALQFTVSGVTGGQFELVSNAGVAITTFTQAQLTAGDVQFVHDGDEAAPTYSVSVFDGALTTGPLAATITFTNVDDAPIITQNSLTLNEGQTVVLGAGDLVATDVETADAALQFTVSGVTGGQFELVSNAGVAITTFTQAQLTAGDVQFVHDGNEAAPTYSVSVFDGALTTGPLAATISFTNVDDAPIITQNSLTLNEGQTVVVGAGDLAATDVETADAALQFTVSGVTGGQFELVSNAGVAITTFTQAQLTAGDVQFVHDGNEAAPTYSVSVFDGALTTGPQAAAVTFTNVDDAPIITQNSLTISEGQTVVLGAGDLAATDVETANATLQFTVSGVTGGQFELVSNAGVAITTFTQAQLTAGDVQFVHDGNEAAPAYSVSVFDGALTTGPVAATITFTNVNDAPVIDLDADDSAAGGSDFATIWVEGAGPVAVVDADAVVSDIDSGSLQALTITIANLLDGADEVLAADTTGTAIVASYSSATGVLTLTGVDSVANYEQVLRTVTYDNASDTPATTTRVIDFVADDGALLSSTSTTLLASNATDDAPVITANALTVSEGGTVVLGATELAATDAETLDPALQFTVSSVTGGRFELVSNAGVAITTFTQAQLTAGDVQFVHDGDEAAPTYSVSVFDGALTTGPQAAAITFTNVDDAPIITANSLTISEGQTVVLGAGDLAATDVETADAALQFTVSGVTGGQFELVSNAGVAITTFTQAQLTAGDVQFVHDGNEAAPTYSVSVFDGALTTGPLAATISFTNVDDAPIITQNSLTLNEGQTVVLGAGDLAATDVETANATLQFTVSGVTGGQFELVSNAGVAITTFTQAQLTAGDVQFVHDGNETAPTYSVSVFDGALTTGPLAATITFTNVNDAPTAVGDLDTAAEGATITIDLALNDIDPDDGLDLGSIVIVSGPANGSVVVNADGTVDYTHGGSRDPQRFLQLHDQGPLWRSLEHGHGEPHDHAGGRRADPHRQRAGNRRGRHRRDDRGRPRRHRRRDDRCGAPVHGLRRDRRPVQAGVQPRGRDHELHAGSSDLRRRPVRPRRERGRADLQRLGLRRRAHDRSARRHDHVHERGRRPDHYCQLPHDLGGPDRRPRRRRPRRGRRRDREPGAPVHGLGRHRRAVRTRLERGRGHHDVHPGAAHGRRRAVRPRRERDSPDLQRLGLRRGTHDRAARGHDHVHERG